MAETKKGTLGLRVREDGGRDLVVRTEGRSARISQPRRELAADLMGLLDEEPDDLVGVEVDYESVKGQPRRLRRTGEQWVPPAAAPAAPRRRAADGGQVRPDVFQNPYTFVPALPRPARFPEAAAGLADAAPVGHDALHDGLWTGRIGVTMKVETPLLLLDTAAAQTDDKGHATYGPLLRGDWPHLPPTAVKGMLRAAYEAVTNSRFGVFAGHEAPLGHRMNASAGLGMVPARVGDDGVSVDLLTGTAPLGQRPAPQAVMYAAWVPAYDPSPPGHRDRRFEPVVPPAELRKLHKNKVRVLLRLVQHHRFDRKRQAHVADFRYWRVVALASDTRPVGAPRPALLRETLRPSRGSWHELLPDSREAEGWVFVSNQNFSRKHDERVFFGTPIRRELTEELRAGWKNLVLNYQEAHRRADVWERAAGGGRAAHPSDWLGGEPGKTAWSPHQYEADAEKLRPGDLCYARLDARGDVRGLYPVMIARELFAASPADLLHESLRPASRFDRLSPADRVFGWVRQSAAGGEADRLRGAYLGQLRVGPTSFIPADGDGLTAFPGDGLPLAILGQPKPQQGRFYLAAGPADRPEPLPDRTPRANWYTHGRTLRGRKTYPHHAGLAEGYWDTPAGGPTEDPTQVRDSRGRYREYRRPREAVSPDGSLTATRDAFATREGKEQRDNQNRSVRAWVRPGGVFRFSLDVRNLSDLELGALFWLLRLPPGHFHRLGLGKPLGFGSASLEVDPAATELRAAEDWRRHYADLDADLDGALPGTGPDPSALARDFERAMAAVWPGRPRPPQLAAFLDAAQGDPTVSVHYPRVRPADMDVRVAVPPDPRGQAYSWFVQNEQERGGTFVRAVSLPLADGDPLPIYEAPDRGPRPQRDPASGARPGGSSLRSQPAPPGARRG